MRPTASAISSQSAEEQPAIAIPEADRIVEPETSELAATQQETAETTAANAIPEAAIQIEEPAESAPPAEEQLAITTPPEPTNAAEASELAALDSASAAETAVAKAPTGAALPIEGVTAAATVPGTEVAKEALEVQLPADFAASDSTDESPASIEEAESSNSPASPEFGEQAAGLAVSSSAPAVSIEVDMAVITSEGQGSLRATNEPSTNEPSTNESSETAAPETETSGPAAQGNSALNAAAPNATAPNATSPSNSTEAASSDAIQAAASDSPINNLVDHTGADAASDGSQDDTQTADSPVLEPLPQKDDLTTAQPLSFLEFEQAGALEQDSADLFQLSFATTGIFTANLNSLSADADVQLIQDKNVNGQVDAGEIVAWEREHYDGDESIRHFVQEGDYVLRILDQDLSLEPTSYNVSTTFQTAETDDRAFSINVVFQSGVDQLNEQAKQAIERAADYWENVISHSSFDRPLELALGIYGTTDTANPYLAYAGPLSYQTTEDDKLLPVVGATVLNNVYLDQYNSNPDYLESILRHEIGHVLGLGVTWDQQGNDLVDQDTASYRADTYAGQSYGEWLGTGIATAIPLDRASLTHWDEETFDAELMTPTAEGIGNPLPLSQMTISSLRDLGWNVNYGAAEPFTLGSTDAIA